MSGSRTTPGVSRDRGFTLPELLICVVLIGVLMSALGMTISTAMRNAPAIAGRADTALAVQGITTWLPPDVDSAEPGRFDTAIGTPSGCAGVDPGTNILRLQWSETFRTITTTYVANYRFVVTGDTARIVRLFCKGTFTLSSPEMLRMSAELAPTQPTVTHADADGDGKTDKVQLAIVALSGEQVFIEAATKNPNETLPTLPPTATTAPAPNAPPVAGPAALSANPSSQVALEVPAFDPDGDQITVGFPALPGDWLLIGSSGTTVTLLVGATVGIYTLPYVATDPAGASATSTITVDVTEAAVTTTTSTTTTTTIPICTIGSITATPNPVALHTNGTGKLKKDVTVTISGLSGYCVGLTLQYVTGAPNGQYVQSFGTAAPFTVSLIGHPQGTELWTAGAKVLEVRDGYGRLLAQTTLTVTG